MKRRDHEPTTVEGQQLARVGAALRRAAPIVGPAMTEHVFSGRAKMCFSFRQLYVHLADATHAIPEPILRRLDEEFVSPAPRAGGSHGLLESPQALIGRVADWAIAQDAEILHGRIGDREFRVTWSMMMMKISVGLVSDAARASGVASAMDEVRRLAGMSGPQDGE